MRGHYQKLQTFLCLYVESQNKEGILALSLFVAYFLLTVVIWGKHEF